MANQVILKKQLTHEDCIFLWARGLSLDTPIQNVVLPFIHLPKETFFVSFNFLKNWQKMQEMDEWFTQLVQGNDFIFYPPQTGANLFYLILSHPLCRGFYYLEEGRGSYLKQNELLNTKKPSFLRDILYQVNFKNRSKNVKHFYDVQHPKYLGAYGMSDATFPDLPNSESVGLPFKKIVLKENYAHILALQPLVENGEVKAEEQIAALKDFLAYLKKNGVQEIHIKFHPSQRKEVSVDAITSLFTEASFLEMEVIPREVSLELVAASAKPNFYVFTSSVGLYAILCGAKVYDLSPLLTSRNPHFQHFVDGMPALQRERSIPLD